MRVVFTLCLAVFLSACSGPGTAAFRQAAPMPAPVGPPPAYTPGFAPGTPGTPVYAPAGTGLPEVGQPGQETANVPRSPNTRVLPVSDEPGLWAADEVRASAGAPPSIAGVPLPAPPPGESTVAGSCADSMNQAITDANTANNLRRLSEKTRRCVAAQLFRNCVKAMKKAVPKFKHLVGRERIDAQARAADDLAKSLAGDERRASKFADEECKDVPVGPDSYDIVLRTTREWERWLE